VIALRLASLQSATLFISLQDAPRIIGMGAAEWHFDEPPGSLLDASSDKPPIETTGRLQSAQVVATTRAEQAGAAEAPLQGKH
jgi:hypothetical protein